MTFQELNLIEPLKRAVAEKGYTTPTPIQQQAIPPALEGRDLMGCAQTGTGKTAAFTLPILQLLAAEPRTKGRRTIKALVLTPTRELAAQIDECCRDYARYTDIRHCVIFGGVNQRPPQGPGGPRRGAPSDAVGQQSRRGRQADPSVQRYLGEKEDP